MLLVVKYFFGHKYLMDWICIRFVFAAFNVSLGVELERARARALKAQAQTKACTDEAYVQQGFDERSKLDEGLLLDVPGL